MAIAENMVAQEEGEIARFHDHEFAKLWIL